METFLSLIHWLYWIFFSRIRPSDFYQKSFLWGNQAFPQNSGNFSGRSQRMSWAPGRAAVAPRRPGAWSRSRWRSRSRSALPAPAPPAAAAAAPAERRARPHEVIPRPAGAPHCAPAAGGEGPLRAPGKGAWTWHPVTPAPPGFRCIFY